MLLSIDVIIDLMTRQDCLAGGAYEAVAAGTLLIVSDTEVLSLDSRLGHFLPTTLQEILPGRSLWRSCRKRSLLNRCEISREIVFEVEQVKGRV